MISFDIFNTLITRTTTTPQGIFALIQQKLLADVKYSYIPSHIRSNFYTLRIQAENLARLSNQCKGLEEVTLEDIYGAMAMSGNLNKESQELLCRLECEVEYENILPVPRNIELLKQLHQGGQRVVLISDMYLPGKVITGMLRKVDEALGQLPIYVSADLGVRKTTGNLYRKVGELEKTEYRDWIHYGDDLFQDIKVAGELGIKTVHLAAEESTLLEQELLKRFADSVSFQMLAGQARYTRDVCENTSTAYKMGCSINGPILYCYVDWLLREAVGKGIKRLYFIARDGYFPKLIADKIISARGLGIETFYMYGSRKAWRFCSLSEEHFNLRELVAWSYVNRITSVQKLAGLLELQVGELIPFLPFGSREGTVELTSRSLYELVDRLEHNREFRDFYLKKQSGKKALVAEYIRCTVDVRDNHFAFVDVSGGGLTQGCLRELMKGYYNAPITTFFFKLDRVNLVPGCVYDVFFPSMLENNLVIEMICRAPHGQTLGYEPCGDGIVPVFDYFENKSLLEHGFRELEAAIEDFTDNLLEQGEVPGLFEDSISVLEAYLNYIAHHPDQEVLEYFASFPNNESGRNQNLVEYAPRLTDEDIKNIFLRRMYWEDISKYYMGTNLEYSLLRCSREEKKLVEWCQENYDTEQGQMERTDKIQKEQLLREKYGRAAYYPCELLEENIILYGAGKLGQDLYGRIRDVGKSIVIKWVDKKLQGEYPAEVESVDAIENVKYDQVVIAVMKEAVAEEIRLELIARGVEEEKIFWTPAYTYRNPWVDWNRLVYGKGEKTTWTK